MNLKRIAILIYKIFPRSIIKGVKILKNAEVI